MKSLLFISTFILFSVTRLWGQAFVFEENKGQWDERVLYKTDAGNGYLFLEKNKNSFLFYDNETFGTIAEAIHHRKQLEQDSIVMKYHLFQKEFLNANENAVIESKFQSKNYNNYFIGNDPKRWANEVYFYNEVIYKNLYDHIDFRYFKFGKSPKYDIILHKGANLKDIKIKYSGADDLVLKDNKLFIKTSLNNFEESIPEAYQFIGEEKIKVDCKFVLKNNIVSFEVEDYNKNYDLIIDPILVFVSYSGTTADNFGFTATYDSKGNFYLGGNVTSAYDFFDPNGKYPATPGAFQQTFSGITGICGSEAGFECDMAISKYDSSGSTLIWATYLGGTNNDYPHSLIVDNHDRLIIFGTSCSEDFPIDTNAFQTQHAGNSDMVLIKFNEGATQLLGSTFIGGDQFDGQTFNDGALSTLRYNYADEFRGEVIIDDENNAYIASCSWSKNFPLENPVDTSTSQMEGVLCKLDSNFNNLLFSTFIGGSNDDALYSLKLDDSLNIITCGGTNSNDINTSANAFKKTYGGGRADGFLTKINPNKPEIIATTYFGTEGYDQTYILDIDRKNQVYVTGQTEGNLPIINATYGKANTSQFITRFKPELDSINLQTTFGNRTNNPELSPTAFLVDRCNNIYYSGWGSHLRFERSGTVSGLETTPDGFYKTSADNQDFYLMVLEPEAKSLLYATFFGGTQSEDHVDGGTSRFDKRGVVYQAICGSCPPDGVFNISDIPTTPGAVYETNLSPRCSNTALKLDFNISYAVDAKFLANPIIGCSPLDVTFTNKSLNASKVLWDFGDGTTDTSFNARHLYKTGGTYTVKLKITDPASCNYSDSVYKTIKVLLKTTPKFDYTAKGCEPTKIYFTNTSSQAISFLWIFPDGSTSKDKDPVKVFSQPGQYTVRLVSNPGEPCSDTTEQVVNVNELPASSKIVIPNVFTPNGDNLNDCFGMGGNLEVCDELKFKIYNRWGELLFDSEKHGMCWYGKNAFNHKKVPAGVYFVVAELTRFSGEKENYKGSLTLIW